MGGTAFYYPPPRHFYPPFALSFRHEAAGQLEYVLVIIELLFYHRPSALGPPEGRRHDAGPRGHDTGPRGHDAAPRAGHGDPPAVRDGRRGQVIRHPGLPRHDL